MQNNKLVSDAILNNTSESFYYKDLDSKFIAASKYHLDYFGIESNDQILGTSDFDYFTKEHAMQAYQDEQQIIRSGKPIVGKIEIETWADAYISYVVTSKYPLYDDEGQIIGTWGHSINVASTNDNKGLLKTQKLEEADIFKTLAEESRIDPLTQLKNTKAFYEIMNLYYQLSLNSLNVQGKEHILAFIDMNGFGRINTTYGVTYGDEALVYASNIIKEFITENIKVFRYAGDKFALLIENFSFEEAIVLCDSILQVFNDTPYTIKEETISLTACVGMSRFKESLPFGNIHDVIHLSDKRLTAAKKREKPTIIYDNSF